MKGGIGDCGEASSPKRGFFANRRRKRRDFFVDRDREAKVTRGIGGGAIAMRRALRRFGGLSGAITNRTLAARNRASRKTNPFRKGIRSVQSVAGSNRLPTRGERWSRFKNRTFCASRGESSLISSSSFAAWTVRCPPNRTIRWSIRCVAMTHCSPRIASIISSVLWRFALELGCDVARTRAIRFARSDQRYDGTARRSRASSASTRREKR